MRRAINRADETHKAFVSDRRENRNLPVETQGFRVVETVFRKFFDGNFFTRSLVAAEMNSRERPGGAVALFNQKVGTFNPPGMVGVGGRDWNNPNGLLRDVAREFGCIQKVVECV
jgi:hypothetical protein